MYLPCLISLVLEYLVPSTGKLYHHKMKLKQLKPTSTVEEQLQYLRKRHPLYFDVRKINEYQITDLLKRLIFRVKYNSEMKNEENNAAISNLQDVVQSPDATKVHDFSANEISNIEEQDNRKKTKIPVKTKNSF